MRESWSRLLWVMDPLTEAAHIMTDSGLTEYQEYVECRLSLLTDGFRYSETENRLTREFTHGKYRTAVEHIQAIVSEYEAAHPERVAEADAEVARSLAGDGDDDAGDEEVLPDDIPDMPGSEALEEEFRLCREVFGGGD
jgi:hypothetical protein